VSSDKHATVLPVMHKFAKKQTVGVVVAFLQLHQAKMVWSAVGGWASVLRWTAAERRTGGDS
jgi:hypothetical protein